jgi:hypothetical protein
MRYLANVSYTCGNAWSEHENSDQVRGWEWNVDEGNHEGEMIWGMIVRGFLDIFGGIFWRGSSGTERDKKEGDGNWTSQDVEEGNPEGVVSWSLEFGGGCYIG